MYSFLVLGIVPGTNIQITFTTWLILALLLGSVYVIRNRVQISLSLESLAHHADQRGVHASQLHRRGV